MLKKKPLESSSAKGYDFGDKKLIRRLFVDVEFELTCTSRTACYYLKNVFKLSDFLKYHSLDNQLATL